MTPRPTFRDAVVALLLLALAATAARYRFGQRENESLPGSDSDAYLHMAKVHAGSVSRDADRPVPKRVIHYNRPLLPWLTALLSRAIPGLTLRSAFSIWNVFLAWTSACLLYGLLRARAPQLRHAWAPPVLFLTAFPQLNWGYHILTDTAGYFFALGSFVLALALAEPRRDPRALRLDLRFCLGLAALFLWQAAGFATRETVCIALAAAGAMAVWRRLQRDPRWLRWTLAATVMVAAKAPHGLWAHAQGFRGPPVHLDVATHLQWRYALDFAVKNGFAFHLLWIFALLGAWRLRGRGAPDWVWCWSLGGALYAVAGYLHNKLQRGFPLRLGFAVFPVVFYLATRFWETLPRVRRPGIAIAGMAAAHAGLSVAMMLLDPGRHHISIYNLKVETLPWEALGASGLGMALFVASLVLACHARHGYRSHEERSRPSRSCN